MIHGVVEQYLGIGGTRDGYVFSPPLFVVDFLKEAVVVRLLVLLD
jgi:hypothetical protein